MKCFIAFSLQDNAKSRIPEPPDDFRFSNDALARAGKYRFTAIITAASSAKKIVRRIRRKLEENAEQAGATKETKVPDDVCDVEEDVPDLFMDEEDMCEYDLASDHVRS